MSLMNLLTDCKFTKVSNGSAAAQTEVDGSAVDMTGFDGVLFVADLGTVTDNCVLTLVAQQGSTSSTATVAITGATTGAQTAATSSNTILIVDVVEPNKQWVRPALTRTAQNAVVNTIIAIQYRTRTKPTVQPTSVLASVLAEATF